MKACLRKGDPCLETRPLGGGGEIPIGHRGEAMMGDAAVQGPTLALAVALQMFHVSESPKKN